MRNLSVTIKAVKMRINLAFALNRNPLSTFVNN
jgi:hypothetical protein